MRANLKISISLVEVDSYCASYCGFLKLYTPSTTTLLYKEVALFRVKQIAGRVNNTIL